MRAILFAIICLTLSAQSHATPADDFIGGSNQGNAFSNEIQDEFLPVEEAYVLNAEVEDTGESPRLRLNWDIAEGYYLYRHGFSFALQSGGQPLSIQPNIPAGKEKQDEYFGRVQVYYHNIDVYLPDLPSSRDLVLAVTSQGCADAGLCYPPHTEYFNIDSGSLQVFKTGKPSTAATVSGEAPPAINQPGPSRSENRYSLVTMLLFAMLGGAILNLMPCVFPVLSLKVLGFANDKGHSPPVHGLSYSAGVVISFVVVAAVLVSLKAAGQAVGWGFHLQSPWFVAALSYLFFTMGLSLSGFIEVGSQWMNLGGRLAEKSGYGGSFFTGVLATVVASPCTAPFMGTALGFAVTQPTLVALLVFAALGAGMALPILVLSCSPGLLKHIPKPGPWMETLKQLLAFPLYATAIWLAWVVGNQTGVNGMAGLLLGCLLIVLALWFWRGGLLRRGLGAACIAVALGILGSSLLHPTTGTAADTDNWQAYTNERLQQLRAEGKPVFINITADWCITCLTNEKVTLSTDRVKQTLLDRDITYLKGDWTNYNPEITELLQEYGRTGIPLYLVYPAGNQSRARVLPQILTVETVVGALTEATPDTTLAGLPGR